MCVFVVKKKVENLWVVNKNSIYVSICFGSTHPVLDKGWAKQEKKISAVDALIWGGMTVTANIYA